MPELPEVETIRQTLQQLIRNRTIEHVQVHWSNIIKAPDDAEQFKHLLVGQTIRTIDRRKKLLLLHLDDYLLISHLRMKAISRVHSQDDPLKFLSHVIFSFTHGEDLRDNHVRQFGTMHLFHKGDERS